MKDNLRSDVVNITKTFDNVNSTLNVATKKLNSVAETMASYASKTNVGLYRDLQGQIQAYEEQIKDLMKVTEQTKEAVLDVHKRDARIVSGFDL